jgi:uncharacterized damage-inducible protein DinB
MDQGVIFPTAGMTREIGFSFAGMEEVRTQLIAAVADLSLEDTGRLAVPEAHSIGGLLLHIGEAEWWWTQCVIPGRQPTSADEQTPFWDVLKEPKHVAERKYSTQFCLDEIGRIRDQTRSLLTSFNDAQLDRVFAVERRGEPRQLNLRWILHHLIDHEAQHKGQIFMLKRLLGLKNEGLFD